MSPDECLWLGYMGARTPVSSSLTPLGVPTQSFIGGKELVFLPGTRINQPPSCPICETNLMLLLQLYWPLHDSSYDRLFHVFACRNNSCWNQAAGWVVLRSLFIDSSLCAPALAQSQPHKPAFEVADWDEPIDAVELGKTAEGEMAQYQSALQEGANLLPSKLENLSIESKTMDNSITHLSAGLDCCMLEYIEASCVPAANEDNTHELSLYNDYMGSGGGELGVCIAGDDLEETDVFNDKTAEKFYREIAAFPTQVIRYQRRGSPLWACSKFEHNLSLIPNCESCGCKRTFEFQLLPTLVDYLKIGENTVIEFGNVFVFTCADNCWDARNVNFRSECVVVHPDPDIHSLQNKPDKLL